MELTRYNSQWRADNAASVVSDSENRKWFEKYKRLYIKVETFIEDGPKEAQQKWKWHENPHSGYDDLIDYEGEFSDLEKLSRSVVK